MLPGLKMTRLVSIFLLRQASIFLCGADTLGTDMTLQRGFVSSHTYPRAKVPGFCVLCSGTYYFLFFDPIHGSMLSRHGQAWQARDQNTLFFLLVHRTSSLTVSSSGCAYLEEAIWLIPCKHSVKTVCSARLETCKPARERQRRQKYLSRLCSEIQRDRASLLIPVSVVGLSDPELEHDRTRHGRVVSAAVTPGVHCKQRQIVGVRLRILKSRG